MTPNRANASIQAGLEPLFAIRPILFVVVVLSVVFVTSAYKFWSHSILSCNPTGYDSYHYLGYCQAEGYGDYEHGAFWFNLEPPAQDQARKANALFVGDSRLQFAFSTKATSDWFASASSSYYLMGFLAWENYLFADELIRKLSPQAKIYIINLDTFFERSESPPAKIVLHSEGARDRDEAKRRWQVLHQSICKSLSIICGHNYDVFRSRLTGAYTARGLDHLKYKPALASYDQGIDQRLVKDYTETGRGFLPQLPVSPECVIFTIVPTVGTHVRTANAIAADLGVNFVAPELDGLETFDGSHLALPSAERWSEAFLAAAGPQILRCMEDQPTASTSTPPTSQNPLSNWTPKRPR
jgi:hypothetical protein